MRIDYFRPTEDMFTLSGNFFSTVPHAHEGVELIYVKSGHIHTVMSGVSYTLTAGQLHVVFPNSIHHHKNTDADAMFCIFPISTLPEFKNTLYNKVPHPPVLPNPNPEAIEFLEKLVYSKEKYKPEARRGILMAAFSLILEDLTLIDSDAAQNARIGEILAYCDTHCTENLTLDSVAKSLLISKSTISHTFSEKFRIGFRDYINSCRLRQSLRLLTQDDLSVTEIAYASGFESIRTFNRAFKKEFQLSPLQYKKTLL